MSIYEQKITPYDAESSPPKGKVLVFAPHPDDEVFGCGGAIIKHTTQGDQVMILVVTDGAFATTDDQKSADYSAIRRTETLNAASIMGNPEIVFLDYPDRSLVYGEELIAKFLSHLQSFAPSIVYLPSFVEAHPDHRLVCAAVVEASRRYEKNLLLCFYEVGQILQPNLLLDISDVHSKLQDAIDCFQSQLKVQNYKQQIVARHVFRTYTLSKETKAAEAYFTIYSDSLKNEGLPSYITISKESFPAKNALEEFGFPLISIIVRTTNRPELHEALHSITMQTYPNIEIILVDAIGNQSAGLGNFPKRFPINYVSKGEMLNRPSASNMGLMHVSGDYFSFLDEDDLIYPNHITDLYEHIIEQKVSIAHSNVIMTNQRNETIKVFDQAHDGLRILHGNNIPNHAILYSSTLLKHGLVFDESLEIFEDWDFIIQCSHIARFSHLDKITAVYRNLGQSGAQDDASKITEYRTKVLEKWKTKLTGNRYREFLDYLALTYNKKLLNNLEKSLDEYKTNNELLRLRNNELKNDLLISVKESEKAKFLIENFKHTNNELNLALNEVQEQLAKIRIDYEALFELHKSAIAKERLLSKQVRQKIHEKISLRSELLLAKSNIKKLASQLSDVSILQKTIVNKNQELVENEKRLIVEKNDLSDQLKKANYTLSEIYNSNFWYLKKTIKDIAYSTGFTHLYRWIKSKTIKNTNSFSAGAQGRITKEALIIRESGLFNTKYYQRQYPDVVKNIAEPVFHYCQYGWKEGRNPSPEFDTLFYMKTYNDVAKAGINPFYHYIKHGLQEGRLTLPENKNTINGNLTSKSPIKRLGYLINNTKESPTSLFRKIINSIKHSGFRASIKKIKHRASLQTHSPATLAKTKVYHYEEPYLTNEIRTKLKSFDYKPLISIIMPVYNISPKWLEQAVKSVEKQWYENWELCIADDASTKKDTIRFLKTIKNKKIKIVYLDHNQNISGASNKALALATGSYISLLDNDDELTPDALYEMVKALNSTKADFIYSDEDKIEMSGRFSDPHFKPGYSPDLLLSQNYICHLALIKKELVDKAGGFTVGLDGAQDYDLFLKVLEHAKKVVHIPKVLYHWRKIPGSTASVFGHKSYAQKAGKNALINALNRRNIKGKILHGKHPGTYRVRYDLKERPLVSIIIPFKDKPELLKKCIGSIISKSTYQNFEVIAVNNGSNQPTTYKEIKALKKEDNRIHFFDFNKPFNYSQINNYAVSKLAQGTQLVLMNNDIEIISPDWIESLLEFSQREDVGVVGAKLYYPNNTIQHAGIAIGVLTLAGHSFRHTPRDAPAYMGRESVVQNLSAVTAALMMVKKKTYLQVSGMDEKNLKIAFNDIDLCLRIREAGFLNIYTPYCEAYHHESYSRGTEDTKEKQARFMKEVHYCQSRHKEILKTGDPYYNPNLSLLYEDYRIA